VFSCEEKKPKPSLGSAHATQQRNDGGKFVGRVQMRTLHLFLVRSNESVPVPRVQLRQETRWQLAVHVLSGSPTAVGRCAGEAYPYLGAMMEHYDTIGDDDIGLFAHAHDVSWHAPVPLQDQVHTLLASREYLSSQPFGGVYCGWRRVPLTKHLNSRMPAIDLWNMVFRGTAWQGALSGISSASQPSYPCCGTFFVHWQVVRKHERREYARARENLAAACSDGSELLRQHPRYANRVVGGRIFEGSWHAMLANKSDVPRPPFCKGVPNT
jgi:hypothetical protein